MYVERIVQAWSEVLIDGCPEEKKIAQFLLGVEHLMSPYNVETVLADTKIPIDTETLLKMLKDYYHSSREHQKNKMRSMFDRHNKLVSKYAECRNEKKYVLRPFALQIEHDRITLFKKKDKLFQRYELYRDYIKQCILKILTFKTAIKRLNMLN